MTNNEYVMAVEITITFIILNVRLFVFNNKTKLHFQCRIVCLQKQKKQEINQRIFVNVITMLSSMTKSPSSSSYSDDLGNELCHLYTHLFPPGSYYYYHYCCCDYYHYYYCHPSLHTSLPSEALIISTGDFHTIQSHELGQNHELVFPS